MIELPSGFGIDSAVAAAGAAKQKTDSLGQANFLRMLVAQLENQDPLNPQDGTEFTAQLATFTSLEQQIAMRESLEQLVAAQQSTSLLDQNLRAASLIGREVWASGQQLEVTDAQAASGSAAIPVHYSLAGEASAARMEIRDARGNLVRSIELSQADRSDGSHALTWDGRDSLGNAVRAGVFSFEVVANFGSGSVTAETFTVGTVTATTLGDGATTLRLGNRVIQLADVLEVRRASSGGN